MVALIWATVSSYFFFYDGWKEVAPADLVIQYEQSGKTLIQFFDAPTVVKLVCNSWLGALGGVLALLGVVAAPITSGDTAFRSARLIIAEFLHIKQRSMIKRLVVAIPIFAASIAFLFWQIENPDGFNTIWQYFGWSNQTLSVFTLWAITIYLVHEKKPYIVTLIPAVFMTVVCITFILVSKNGFGIPMEIGYGIAGAIMVLSFVWFFIWKTKSKGVR